MIKPLLSLLTLVALLLTIGCNGGGGSGDSTNAASDNGEVVVSDFPFDANAAVTDSVVRNQVAYISAQCYTKTEDDAGEVHNPCYSCHQRGVIPNYLNDSDLQLEYAFPELALKNPWSNLFVDRSAEVAAISDQEIRDYVRRDNYQADDGTIMIADLLRHLPGNWDLDGDGEWNGYIPDCYFDFDDEGFDRDPNGDATGWRAFAYAPFLGTFWPTNGSTDDVLIRLAEPFREDESGISDRQIYKLNLAIVEAMIMRRDIIIEPADETWLNVDLDKDGALGTAERVVYDWAPLEGRTMSYVGRARLLQEQGQLHLAAGLFPEGTEFLHSVRYIDVSDAGEIQLAPRMKELRYGRKGRWYNYSEIKGVFDRENAEKAVDQDITKFAPGDMERGLFALGWHYQGFIEDKDGHLRPQTKEETLFCIGCHGGVGANTDTVFAFPRKFDHQAFQGGWYHWSDKGLAGTPEPVRADGRQEYAYYLENNGAGDEFHANAEVMERFFDPDGELKPEALAELRDDISVLLFPSQERALMLNKAYRVIVQEQSFVNGRDATVTPADNVHREVEQNLPTGVTSALPGPF